MRITSVTRVTNNFTWNVVREKELNLEDDKVSHTLGGDSGWRGSSPSVRLFLLPPPECFSTKILRRQSCRPQKVGIGTCKFRDSTLWPHTFQHAPPTPPGPTPSSQSTSRKLASNLCLSDPHPHFWYKNSVTPWSYPAKSNRKTTVDGMVIVKKLENVLSCPAEQLGLDIDSRILRQSDTGWL